MDWQLQQAEGHLGEIVERAHKEGPQFVSVEGERSAVVLSIEEYRRLREPASDLKDWLLNGPVLDDETVAILNDRPKLNRDVEF
ncbi:type II toxin-antitoxin system Phd/YefM family antitoxin [Azospirillum sp.]|uniref:type II toxin-antitoxin system Phd/YefM family antitoxin n=1 Tax=Azospirillum sp. TaxID=34012 RepID=UPI002D33D955|nr:type II toxin-antitoxin system Phd/YefM family antitoxin [Azospirillum sp.]HYD71052.1 type II toxin-antitoxin system Phd/YefM family antitoxin [Azospirillum sp.]